MKVIPPEHPFCWVNNKWGRHKARALLEEIDRYGNTRVQVYFLSSAFQGDNKTTHINKKHVEYIKEE